MIARRSRRFLITFASLALLAAALLLTLRSSNGEHLRSIVYPRLLRHGDLQAENVERTAAAAAYREATRLRPDDALPHLRLAQLYLDWGRTEEALEAAAEAERLAADSDYEVDLLRLQIAIHEARTDWPAVIEHARRLLALESADEGARRALARAYLKRREWGAARAEYQALLGGDPSYQTFAVAHERLGALLIGHDPAAASHLLTADTELAGRLLAAFQRVEPEGDAAYTAAILGRVLFEAREWALAAYHFERALAHNADYPDAHAYLGGALDQLGYLDEAEPHLERAVELAPDSVLGHTFLGLHHERSGDISAARAEYEAAYDLDPGNPAICVEIGQTWAAEGDYVVAELWLRNGVALRPGDPALWEILARFYLNHNITAAGRAIEITETLVELTPEDAVAHDLRGWAALQVGEYEVAREHFQQAINLDPELASAYYHWGLLELAEGNQGKAEEAFIRALDLDTSGALIPLVERARNRAF